MITKIVMSIILAFLAAQTSKTITNYKKTKKFDWILFFFQNGGMPSSHTATAVALTLGLFIETGFSYLFIISAFFSIIVINDAMKLRLEVEEEAKIINRMREKEHTIHKKLNERVGHTPIEVLVGILTGILCTAIVYLI